MNKKMSYEDELKEELELVRCDLHNAYNRLESEQQENEQLKERIDKAIELLEKGIIFCENDSQGVYDKCNIAINREKKVLEILRGESNE